MDEWNEQSDEKSDFNEDEIWMVGNHQTVLWDTTLK
jgi:hypothetical protein